MKKGGFCGGSVVKNLPAKFDTRVQSLGQEDPMEEEMTTYSSISACEISLTEVAWQATIFQGSQKNQT